MNTLMQRMEGITVSSRNCRCRTEMRQEIFNDDRGSNHFLNEYPLKLRPNPKSGSSEDGPNVAVMVLLDASNVGLFSFRW